MKLAASHRHRHHVIQLHLRHERAHELFRGVHHVEQIDPSFNPKILKDGYGDFGGDVSRASP